MSLNKQQADRLAEVLRGEFNAVADFHSTSSLNDGPKVDVYAVAGTPEETLQAIEDRANALAGFKMGRNDFEFKTGRKDF